MPQIEIPVEITYQTKGGTPVKDVIAALQAAELLIENAVALLPSLLDDGTDLTLVSIGIRRLSQESPLSEILIVGIFVAAQRNIEAGIVSATKSMTGIDVSPELAPVLTLVVLVVLFHGVGLARNVLQKAIAEGPARRTLSALIDDVAAKTGKSTEDVNAIIMAKYSRPGPVKSLVSASLAFFRPSHHEGATSIQVGTNTIPEDVVRDVPLLGQVDPETALERFTPHVGVALEIHAQDRDKGATGWAAMVPGVTASRVKMKVMPPIEPAVLWGRERIIGDIVLISRLTSEGYEPTEIHLTSIVG